MRLCSIVSGSSGNCVYLDSGDTHLLIDIGCSARQAERGMAVHGLDPKDLDGILVTHEHGDHIKGVGAMSRRFKLPIYANMKTWAKMVKKLGKLPAEHRKVFQDGQVFPLKDLLITPFSLHHDAADPVGYAIESEEGKASITTDTGFVDDEMMDTVAGSDIYYFEANHDVDMVMTGPYPPQLKKRILSSKGHLSNNQAGEALSELLTGYDEVVLLAHMSTNNNRSDLCFEYG